MAKIPIEDLPDEVLERLGVGQEVAKADMPVEEKLVVMGKVIRCIAKMSNRDALWVLRGVIQKITGRAERRGGNRNNNHDGSQ